MCSHGVYVCYHKVSIMVCLGMVYICTSPECLCATAMQSPTHKQLWLESEDSEAGLLISLCKHVFKRLNVFADTNAGL